MAVSIRIRLIVESGLEDGDVVISEGAAYLKEDSKIRIS